MHSPRFGIVVPYRNREEHLRLLVPHLRQYFRLNGDIACRILIVEQSPELLFNRGLIKNIGYKYLAAETDYICFHDVDLLPICADYTWPFNPAMLVSEGLPFKREFILRLFGGVVLVQNGHFERANGYSNSYWGWGFEDVDLRERLLRLELPPEHRSGRFKRLAHVDEGSHAGRSPSDDHLKNRAIYAKQWFVETPTGWRRRLNVPGAWQNDGLNSLNFNELHPKKLLGEEDQSESRVIVEHVLVSLIAEWEVKGAHALKAM